MGITEGLTAVVIDEGCTVKSFVAPCPSPDFIWEIKSRRMRWAGHVARMREIRNIMCKVLVGKPEGKRPHGRPKHRWEGNIRNDLKEIGWKGVDWLHFTPDMNQAGDLLNTAMNLRVLWKEDNIRKDVKEDWIPLTQDTDQRWALVNTAMNLRVPHKTRDFLTRWATISFLRRTPLHVVVSMKSLVRR